MTAGVHAETLLGFTAVTERLRVARLSTRAIRIRANGHAARNDLLCFGLQSSPQSAAA